MNWFRFALAAAGIAAGAAAVAASIVKKEEDREMDDYLMSDPDVEEEVICMPERIQMDAEAWKNLDDDSLPVRISYAVEDAETAAMAQELLAEGGYSSSMDTEADVLDVLYTQEQPVDVLVDCAGLDGVLYTGYCIAE